MTLSVHFENLIGCLSDDKRSGIGLGPMGVSQGNGVDHALNTLSCTLWRLCEISRKNTWVLGPTYGQILTGFSLAFLPPL